MACLRFLTETPKTTEDKFLMDMKIQSDDFVFLPLGGSGEIGMNANLYHYKERWLMVDLGISFPDESMPGVDVVLPDLRFSAIQDLIEA